VLLEGEGAGTRVGMTVSRKVGNAVVRNRIKRWLREAVRMVPGPRGGPWDLVLIPKAEALDVGLWGLRDQLGDLFARVRR
jgi:ribonuclease P protein component